MGLESPSRAEVERQFERLLSGAVGRDEVDRWAGRFLAEGVPVEGPAVWIALERMHGIDLPDGPDGGFLHDLEQVADWLAELRESGSEGAP